jgi:hypothetical protein
VSIKTAASAIIDDLVSSGSFHRTQVSACDYGVLDMGGGCAVVVRPGLSTFQRIGYGGGREDTWGLTAEGYVQDTGNVAETLRAVLDMHAALIGAIDYGTDGNTDPLTTRVVSISHNPDVVYGFGGRDYFRVTANVQSREDP